MGYALLLSKTGFCQRSKSIMDNILKAISVTETNNFREINDDGRTLLHNFYTQIGCRPIRFSVSGFYVIDFALMASMFTGIVSYQVILIQVYIS